MERVQAESKRIRIQFQNASWRLKKNIRGIDLGGEEPEAPPTALRNCCSANLKRIEKVIENLGKLFEELQSCYDGAGDSDGTIALEFVKADLAEFGWGMRELAKVQSQEAALKRLAGVTRVLIKYRDGVEGLQACPAEPKAADEGDKPKE
jgi:hypothetical protein